MTDFLQKNRHVFFSGIGGIGMSGIAEILLQYGYQVSGSDRELSNITEYLSEKGAHIFEGHKAKNIAGADLLVYSSAIPEDNPERQEAQRSGLLQVRRAEMLADIMRLKHGIAIAGTHGKTTTTSLCAEVAIHGGLDPTVVVGGRLRNQMTNALTGKGLYFITEADEYDKSFLALSPVLAIITGVEADHLECYGSFDNLKNAFLQFAGSVPFFGSVICCLDDHVLQSLIPQIHKAVITYGFSEGSHFRASNAVYEEMGSRFDLQVHGESMGKISIRIPGLHNVKNALAAIAMGFELQIPLADIQAALDLFSGVERRFEIKAESAGRLIVDDYAHHPTEVHATLSSARSGWHRRIIAIFQPHLFSRTQRFYKEFAQALSAADVAVITDIYPAREKPIKDVSAALISDRLVRNGHKNVHYIREKEEIIPLIQDISRPGDMLLTMGAGDIWKVAEKLASVYKQEEHVNRTN